MHPSLPELVPAELLTVPTFMLKMFASEWHKALQAACQLIAEQTYNT